MAIKKLPIPFLSIAVLCLIIFDIAINPVSAETDCDYENSNIRCQASQIAWGWQCLSTTAWISVKNNFNPACSDYDCDGARCNDSGPVQGVWSSGTGIIYNTVLTDNVGIGRAIPAGTLNVWSQALAGSAAQTYTGFNADGKEGLLINSYYGSSAGGYLGYTDLVSLRYSSASTGGSQFRFFTQPIGGGSAGDPLLKMAVSNNGLTVGNGIGSGNMMTINGAIGEYVGTSMQVAGAEKWFAGKNDNENYVIRGESNGTLVDLVTINANAKAVITPPVVAGGYFSDAESKLRLCGGVSSNYSICSGAQIVLNAHDPNNTNPGNRGTLVLSANGSMIGGELPSDNLIKFETNFNQRMVIDNDGKVGIGTATPSVNLEVLGKIKLSGTNPWLLTSYIYGATGAAIENITLGDAQDNIIVQGTVSSTALKTAQICLGTSGCKTDWSQVSGALPSLYNAKFWLGNSINQPIAVSMDGDAYMSNAGVVTIQNNVITTAKIADAAVTGAKVGVQAINTNNLSDLAVTSAKLADGAVTTSRIAGSAVTSAKILDATILSDDLAGSSVTSAKISDGTIATADLGDGSVTSAKIANGAIVAADLSALGATATGQVLKYTIGTGWAAADNVGDGTGGWIDGTNIVTLATAGDKVGIGTTAPAEKLDVNGPLTVRGAATGHSANQGIFDFYNGSTRIISRGTDASTYGGMEFVQTSAGDEMVSVPMKITPTGNVGIGTTNPLNLLSLANDKYVGWRNGVNTSETVGIKSSASDDLQFYVGGTRMTIANDGIVHVNSFLSVDTSAKLANNTGIDPDSFSNSIVAGQITDGSGWSATGIGGKGSGSGDTWGIGYVGSALYFGVGNSSANNSLYTFLQVDSGSNVSNFYGSVKIVDAVAFNNNASRFFELPRGNNPGTSCGASTIGYIYMDTDTNNNGSTEATATTPGPDAVPCICVRQSGTYKWAPFDNWGSNCND